MFNTKCIASKSDYDCYTLHLPVSVILNSRKNKYIYSQLEKLHPCFSKDFSYRYRTRINRKGMYSDVIVMNNYKIKEYRTKYPEKKIWINEVQDTFEDFGKKKRLLRVLIVVLFICCLGALSYLSLTKKKEAPASVIPVQIETVKNHNELKDLLEIVNQKNGKLTFLNCVYEKEGLSYEANLQNIYPEDLWILGNNLNFKNVIYSDGHPLLSVSLGKPANGKKIETGLTSSQLSEIRQIISDNSGILLKENVKESLFSFSLNNGTENFNLFQEIEKLCLREGCGVKRLTVHSNENESFSVDMVFIPASEGINVDQIYLNKNIFKINKKIIPVNAKKKIEKIETKAAELGTKEKELIKIGEILKSDGTRIYYYKNKNGKILKEVK